jgi:hypothetical protein
MEAIVGIGVLACLLQACWSSIGDIEDISEEFIIYPNHKSTIKNKSENVPEEKED